MADIPKILQEAASICQNDWTAKQLKILIWLANPTRGKQRELATELAGLIGKPISEWTDADEQKMIYQEQLISKTKALPGFKDDLARFAALVFIEYDLEVDRANLRDATRDPSSYPDIATSIMKARELYYKRRGLLIDRKELTGQGGGAIKTETTVKDERLNEYTDEELDYILEAAKSRADISESGGGETTPE